MDIVPWGHEHKGHQGIQCPACAVPGPERRAAGFEGRAGAAQTNAAWQP